MTISHGTLEPPQTLEHVGLRNVWGISRALLLSLQHWPGVPLVLADRSKDLSSVGSLGEIPGVCSGAAQVAVRVGSCALVEVLASSCPWTALVFLPCVGSNALPG